MDDEKQGEDCETIVLRNLYNVIKSEYFIKKPCCLGLIFREELMNLEIIQGKDPSIDNFKLQKWI